MKAIAFTINPPKVKARKHYAPASRVMKDKRTTYNRRESNDSRNW